MRKKLNIKQVATILLPIILLIGILAFVIPRGEKLKASNEEPFVSLQVAGEDAPATGYETSEETVDITLNTTETKILEIPTNDQFQVTPIDDEGNTIPYPEISNDEFTKKETLKSWQSQLEKAQKAAEATTESSDVEDTSEAEVPVEEMVPYLQVDNGNQNKDLYIKLDANESKTIRVTRSSAEAIEAKINQAFDTSNEQTLVKFLAIDSLEPEISLEDTSEEIGEETSQDENFVGETNSDTSDILDVLPESRNISGTTPFRATPSVGRKTGVADAEGGFDSKTGDGYDESENNEYIRTWDRIIYEPKLTVSNVDAKYKSLEIRLDTFLKGSWRKDSSGAIRQTAEIVNGTLSATGNVEKDSSLTQFDTMTSAQGEAFFTPVVKVFGGVNEDEIVTNFKFTIVSATLQNGEVEPINQVIDASVNPLLEDKTIITAQPLVDVKVETTTRKAPFNKATGATDKPNSFVANIGAYAQLKPLPNRSGAGLTSIKGATYPVGGIQYDIKQKVSFTNDATKEETELELGVDTDPIRAIVYEGFRGELSSTARQFTDEYSQFSNSYNRVSFQGMSIPYGYTNQTFPDSNNTASTTKGVYNTGSPIVRNMMTDNTIRVINSNYLPISIGKNKWTYAGVEMSANSQPFSAVGLQAEFPYEYMKNQIGINGTLTYRLSVDSVHYEGKVQNTSDQANITWDNKWPGNIHNYTTFKDETGKKLNSNSNDYSSFGDGMTTEGNSIMASFYTAFTDPEAEKSTLYARWNANSFKFDTSKSVQNWLSTGIELSSLKYSYGIGKKNPDVSLRKQSDIESEYTWYDTVEEAQDFGEIVAVKRVGDVVSADGFVYNAILVPFKVTGPIGVVDSVGNPNIALTNAFNEDGNGNRTRYFPQEGNPDYTHTEYDSDGNWKKAHSPSTSWGDTLYISGITIRPKILVDKVNYAPSEKVNWLVSGVVDSGAEGNHKVKFVVTIPEEVEYDAGSAKDYNGEGLPDPNKEINNNGTQTLTWIIDFDPSNNSYSPSISFATSIISSKIIFVNNSASFSGKVVSEIWVENDENIRDSSKEDPFRTSTTEFSVSNQGVIVIDKIVDKPLIDSGNKVDLAQSEITHPTDFTYTISYRNQSSSTMSGVRVLDVLPYNDDGRETNFTGSYSVVDLVQNGAIKGDVYYSTSGVPADQDPSVISLSGSAKWKLMTGNDLSVISNAKAILIVYNELAAGERLSLDITLRPDGQKAGDIYGNSPTMSTENGVAMITGPNCQVKVVGRDLSGVAWYDDSLDGLIGNRLSTPTPEDFAANVPVKLYRTSLVNPEYKDELVEESLTGEQFVNASGESLVKTDAIGKYTFSNLPEGDYYVEFEVDGTKYKVTKQLEGDDLTLNSKAKQEVPHTTPEYTQPQINELAPIFGVGDSINHVTDVNVGLIRPSKIQLFKYETGSATDANGDGELTEEEKSTGKPLIGAEFEIKDEEGQSLGTKTTDKDGNLIFEELFPGKYTLTETKAPDGYELIKSPIDVEINEGNNVFYLYQEDDKKTELPFTGGDTLIKAVIIVAACGLLGTAGLWWYYRRPHQKGVG